MNDAFWLGLTHHLGVMLGFLGIISFAGRVFFFVLDYDTHKRVRWVHYLTATIPLLLFLAAIVCEAYYESHRPSPQPKPTTCESEQK